MAFKQRVSGADASVGEHHVGSLRHGGQVLAQPLPFRRCPAFPCADLRTRPTLETRQQTPHDDQPLLRKERHRAARGAKLGERHLPTIEAGYVDVAEVGRRYLLDQRLDLLIDGERVVAVVETYQGLPPVLRQRAAGTGYNIPLRVRRATALIGLIRLLGLSGGLRLIIKLMLDRRVPGGVKLIIPAAILYIISPVDLIHDFIPFVGRFDDLIAGLAAIALFLAMCPRDVVMEHATGRKPAPRQDEGGPHRRDVIEGSYRYDEDDEQPSR